MWKTVMETRPDVAIRYLGVMVAGNGSAKAQVAKVVSTVNALIERIRTTRCSAALANYLFRACVGGVLNYYGPFTPLSRDRLREWDRAIIAVLRRKSGVRRHRMATLYATDGTGLGWFSAQGAAREAVLTEVWLTLACPDLEGRLVRAQVARANKATGTVFAPWDPGTRIRRRRGKWLTAVEMADDALADLGWTLTTDVPHWGEAWTMPPSRQTLDAPLAEVDPARMRAGADGTTFLQAAQARVPPKLLQRRASPL